MSVVNGLGLRGFGLNVWIEKCRGFGVWYSSILGRRYRSLYLVASGPSPTGNDAGKHISRMVTKCHLPVRCARIGKFVADHRIFRPPRYQSPVIEVSGPAVFLFAPAYFRPYAPS